MEFMVSDEQRDQMIERAALYESSRPTIAFKTGHVRLAMGGASRLSAWRVLECFTKEPETIRWLNTFGADDVLFDVGANVGLYSIRTAAARSARVYAFEPEASDFAR